jgi:hypothetical protein
MVAPMLAIALFAAADAAGTDHQTCGDLKSLYKSKACCGDPDKNIGMQVVPRPYGKGLGLSGDNPCHGTKPASPGAYDNLACIVDDINEQSGAEVTPGVQGQFESSTWPIMTSYMHAGLCPVNVHWHLGAEHKSVGQYDEAGTYPNHGGRRLEEELRSSYHRRLAGDVRYGLKCHHYDASDSRYTTEYPWKHCVGMHVGNTYEVHWPHSAAGDCGTPNQYQTPFYDGVFCHFAAANVVSNDHPSGVVLSNLSIYVGVQAQVFTIINDEDYFYPDLMRGMIIDGAYGRDMAHYTGSTTGTSRSNSMCSAYTPITWQVDRTCHLISASSFDKMCADMKMQRDDLSDDLHAHGAREVVLPEFTANNIQQKTNR